MTRVTAGNHWAVQGPLPHSTSTTVDAPRRIAMATTASPSTTAGTSTREERARLLAVVSGLALAAAHLVLVPEEMEEMFYMGALFAVGGALLIFACVALLRRTLVRLAWMTGSLVSLGMFLGYVASRTIGLPGGHAEEWGEPLGVLSLVLELVFLGAAAVAATRMSTHAAAEAA